MRAGAASSASSLLWKTAGACPCCIATSHSPFFFFPFSSLLRPPPGLPALRPSLEFAGECGCFFSRETALVRDKGQGQAAAYTLTFAHTCAASLTSPFPLALPQS